MLQDLIISIAVGFVVYQLAKVILGKFTSSQELPPKKLIIVSGISGSGKHEIAKFLAEKHSLTLIDQNDFKKAEGPYGIDVESFRNHVLHNLANNDLVVVCRIPLKEVLQLEWLLEQLKEMIVVHFHLNPSAENGNLLSNPETVIVHSTTKFWDRKTRNLDSKPSSKDAQEMWKAIYQEVKTVIYPEYLKIMKKFQEEGNGLKDFGSPIVIIELYDRDRFPVKIDHIKSAMSDLIPE